VLLKGSNLPVYHAITMKETYENWSRILNALAVVFHRAFARIVEWVYQELPFPVLMELI
jgi:hypothetical protein